MRLTSLKARWEAALPTVFFALALCTVAARAQEGCRASAPPPRSHEANIFSEQQEMDLGDAMAEHVQRNFRTSTDSQFVAYLQQIGDRLLKYMPPTHLRVQYFLVDLPDANAFDMVGGRIYVSVKLIALAQNEDELAGVLAHEFGHMVVHQGAVDMTRNLRQTLKVTEVSDRRDIFSKYHQLIETAWRKPATVGRTRAEEQEDQLLADRLAIYAIAGAGYSLDAFPEMFDRIAGTKGKTGNWLTDFFGATSPDSKRLREMIKTAQKLPEKCGEATPRPTNDAFKTWQANVIENLNWNTQELLHGVLSQTRLDPPLRGEILYLKFSPDGRFILAQDSGNIYVLTRQPLAHQFTIDAPDAMSAQFSPDSQSVVFRSEHNRVETWSLASRKRASVHEVVVQKGCAQSDLSPDGKVLACLEGMKDLVLFDVASGDEIYRKDSFVRMDAFTVDFALTEWLRLLFHEDLILEGFSPDARYFLARSNVNTLLYDLSSRQAVGVPGALNKYVTASFAFLGNDRLAAVNAENVAKSHILAFPSGEVLGEFASGKTSLAGATHGNYVMLRPVKDYAVGVIDLTAGKNLFAFRQSALDVYDDVFVSEARDGQVTLSDTHSGKFLAMTPLPQGRLGTLKARAVSPDWKWLAASEEGRGGVWSLQDGKRLYFIRGFQGGYFADDAHLYVDFPKYKDKDREIASLDLSARKIADGTKIDDEHTHQYGDLLLAMKPERKGGWDQMLSKVTYEVNDVRTGSQLWTHYFPKEAPAMAMDTNHHTLLLCWDASSGTAREEMKEFPAATEVQDSRKDKGSTFFVAVMDARTGKGLGSALVNVGSRRLSLEGARASHDWLTISTPDNRVLVYSLHRGEEAVRFFGRRTALSEAGGLLCVENEQGHLTLYDINSGEDLDHWVFPSSLSMLDFSADGKRLFVLTADQVAYVLDLSTYAPANITANSSSQQGGTQTAPQR